MTEGDFALIQDALPILAGRLQHQVRTPLWGKENRCDPLPLCCTGQKISGELLPVLFQTGGQLCL